MTVAITTPVSGRAPELPLRLMLEDGRTLVHDLLQSEGLLK